MKQLFIYYSNLLSLMKLYKYMWSLLWNMLAIIVLGVLSSHTEEGIIFLYVG